ncbi:MAG TPA: sigma-70 family RNA polymerase sigma factor [Gemmatimonadales bacterium]|nr:sigma-70 family RNA polymerase sigma factor [Gemmatimonadales bacterium]
MDKPTTTNPVDRGLLERIAAGDERALGELYDRYGRTVYSLALAILREPADAEEAVIDTFNQVWQSAASYDASRGVVAAWLCTIARSRALDMARARGRRARALERAASLDALAGFEPSAVSDPGLDLGLGELRQLITRSLAALPEAQRQVIEMAYFGGLTQSEIAERLAEPLGTIKTRTRTALEKLRGLLESQRSEAAS